MSLPPDQNIPFPGLISIIHRSHFIKLNEEMRPFGLSAGQFMVLIHLAKQQDITQDLLAKRFHINKATIARAVRRLEDAGYVRRITDQENRRAFRLFLTDKGEQIVPEIVRIDREWETVAFEGLSEEDRELAHRLLRHIAHNSLINAHGRGDDEDE